MLADIDSSLDSQSICQSLYAFDDLLFTIPSIEDVFCSCLLAQFDSFVSSVDGDNVDAFGFGELDTKMS